MPTFHFPKPLPKQPPLENSNDVVEMHSTPGNRAADWIVKKVGSWRFIITQSVLLLIWVILNVTAWIAHWDPYPFILMNLVMSLQAAFTAPIIMMSQNRQSEKDRIEASLDYQVNVRTEEKVEQILAHLRAQNEVLIALQTQLNNVK